MDPKPHEPKKKSDIHWKHCPICGDLYCVEDGHRCPDAEKEDEDEFDEADLD